MARRKRASFLTKQSGTPATRRRQRVFIWLLSLPCVILLLMGVSYLLLVSWLQGDGFREKLAEIVGRATHAQLVEIPQNMDVDGANLTLPQIRIRGAREIDEFSLSKLHLAVDRPALIKRILRFNQFSAEELNLTLRFGSRHAAPAPSRSKKSASPPAPAPAHADGAKGTEKISVPVASKDGFLKAVQARSFEALYSDTSVFFGERELALKGYHLTASPRPDVGRDAWNFSLENGRLVAPFSFLRDSGVKNASILFSRRDITLSSCKILLTPGEIRMHGKYSLLSGNWNVRMNVQRANVARLLNDDWKKKLTGSLDGHLDFTGEGGSSWKAKGELQLIDGLLEGLPVLSSLRLDSSLPYRSIPIRKAVTKLSFPYSDPQHNIRNAWLLDDIDICAKDDTLRCRGRVIIGTDRSLSGTLKIGLPSQTIAKLGLQQTSPVSQLFNSAPELPGWVWLHINLSGTLDDPHEDLSVRLATLLPQAVSSMSHQAVESLNSVLGSFVPGKLLPPEKKDENASKPQDAPKNDDKAKPEEPTPKHPIKNILDSGLKMLL